MAFKKRGATVSLTVAVAGTSVNSAINGLTEGDGQVLVVAPTGTGVDFYYVAFGESGAVAATTSDIPMLPNTSAIFEVPRGTTHVAVNTGVGTGSVRATPGLGAP
jgi:hypothetical protein